MNIVIFKILSVSLQIQKEIFPKKFNLSEEELFNSKMKKSLRIYSLGCLREILVRHTHPGNSVNKHFPQRESNRCLRHMFSEEAPQGKLLGAK